MLTGCTFYNAILLHKNVECKIRQINMFFCLSAMHMYAGLSDLRQVSNRGGPGCNRGVGGEFTFKLSRFPFWCGARPYVMRLKR